MKILCCTLVLGATPVFFGADGPPQAPVGVYVEYDRPADQSVPALIEQNVRAILSPLGFDIEWRTIEAAGKEVWSDLAVVSFQGNCSFDVSPREKFTPGALGWTHTVGGDIQPFVNIDCRRIAALLQTQMTSAPTANPERLFARAVARVVAHELYHVFAKTKTHEESGVGKAEFTVKDLLSDRFQFHPQQARLLRKISREDARFPVPGKMPQSARQEPPLPTPLPASSLYFPRAASQ